MTIEEIKTVSIYQWMRENDFGDGNRKGKHVFYCSPLRSESSPSFAVNLKENLWYDFGSGKGGNLINLVEQLNPTWSEHHVLSYLEGQIKEKNLDYNEDYNAKLKKEEEQRQWVEGKRKEYAEQLNNDTFVEMVIPLTNPALFDYISQRRISFEVAHRFCKEVHYTVRGRRFYGIVFMNDADGMEVRNRLNKRCIGKKSISSIITSDSPHQQCCVFEGFFDFLSYMTIHKCRPDNEICVRGTNDYFVLNGVGEAKLLLPCLKEYQSIHCYLNNDEAGKVATKEIKKEYAERVIDESYRYKEYNDLNDYLMDNTKQICTH